VIDHSAGSDARCAWHAAKFNGAARDDTKEIQGCPIISPLSTQSGLVSLLERPRYISEYGTSTTSPPLPTS
jgi:hypothetical protein